MLVFERFRQEGFVYTFEWKLDCWILRIREFVFMKYKTFCSSRYFFACVGVLLWSRQSLSMFKEVLSNLRISKIYASLKIISTSCWKDWILWIRDFSWSTKLLVVTIALLFFWVGTFSFVWESLCYVTSVK